MTPNSRSYLNRWLQPDQIIPDLNNPLDWDRYSYVRNNPLKYNDPTGHDPSLILDALFIAYDIYQITQEGWTPVNTVALVADVACAIVPVGTGGGPAIRAVASGEDIATVVAAASKAAAKLPEAVRLGQAVEKGIQFIEGGESPGSIDNGNTPSGTKSTNIDPNNITIPRKKASQVQSRGWTLSSIQDTVRNPAMTRSTLDNPNVFNKANGNPVTYYYTAEGYYVVIDNVTGELIQVSDQFDPNWRDPFVYPPPR